jgi:hypothetical protein
MTLDELELYSTTLSMEVMEITRELNMLVNLARENEALDFDCDGAWELVRINLIKAINEINN